MLRLRYALFAAAIAAAPLAGAKAQAIACGGADMDRVEIPFATGSSRLGPETGDAIQRAAERARAQNLRVCVFGKASKLGNADANARLAQARARAVVDALVARGVPRNFIQTASQGEGYGGRLMDSSSNNAQSDRSAEIAFVTQTGQ
jgi:outer membrane protein OmpA-like peptidoglycan-associated protein